MSIIGNEKLFYIDLSNEKLYRFNNSLFVEVSKQIQSTSELTNDGEDGANPFITANDLPIDTNLSNSNQTLDSDRNVDGNGKTLTFENTKTLDLDGLIIENKSIRSDNSLIGLVLNDVQLIGQQSATSSTLVFNNGNLPTIEVGFFVRVVNRTFNTSQIFKIIDVNTNSSTTTITVDTTNEQIVEPAYHPYHSEIYYYESSDLSKTSVALTGSEVYGNNSVAIGENAKIKSDFFAVDESNYQQCLSVIGQNGFTVQGDMSNEWIVGNILYLKFTDFPTSSKLYQLKELSYDETNDITTITMNTDYVSGFFYGAAQIQITTLLGRLGIDNSVVIGKNSTQKHQESVIIGSNLTSKGDNELYVEKLRINKTYDVTAAPNPCNALDWDSTTGEIFYRPTTGKNTISFFIDDNENIVIINELSFISYNNAGVLFKDYITKNKIQIVNIGQPKVTVGTNTFVNADVRIIKTSTDNLDAFVQPTVVLEDDGNNSLVIALYAGAVPLRAADFKNKYRFQVDIIFKPNY